jgi:predicted acylesterase/phospholipase RssA/CRP-like cAMP-binding protein
MSVDVFPLLQVHEYFRDLPDEVLQEVVRSAWVTQHPTGEVVHEADTLLTALGFVLRGRLKAVRVDARGTESLFRMIERGEQFGLMLGAVSEPVPIRVVALEPSTLLRLDYERGIDLTFRYPELRRLWLTTFAGSLRKHFFGTATRHAPMLLALVHESPASRRVAERLIDRLHEVGENLAVLSDSDERRERPGVRFRALRPDGHELEMEEIRQQVAHWQDATRIIFDLHSFLTPERSAQLLALVDRAVYFIPSGESATALARLKALDVPGRGWRDKISIAWLLAGGSHVAPLVPNLGEFAGRDFKIAVEPPRYPQGRALGDGVERLVHDLRGVRIGVALGGGAARGMSHLGALKALEQNGIVIDMLAGTSAGALTGVGYASGFDCDFGAEQFAADLTPSWLFRHLPQGNYWYLIYKYRRGKFDPMLRKYFRDWRLEQLPVPCLTVTVDLVSGKSLARERGDAIHGILESINVPVFSPPIVREGQALIDGGLVNNIPANVLVSMGCNFVIAASVSGKMETEFCHIKSESPAPPRKKPGILPTLLRSWLVQHNNLHSLGVQPADVVIDTDATRFDLAEFSRAKELAAAGAAAALEQVPKIQRLLHRLDPRLFPQTGTAADPQKS